jgi:hypothetical protein
MWCIMVNITFHSFPNMELEWSVALNESCQGGISEIIGMMLLSCTTCDKGIFIVYIWR